MNITNGQFTHSHRGGIYALAFVSFVSLYLYSRVLAILKRKGLSEKLSVNEVLMELSKVYLVRYSDSSQKLSEIPKRVEDLVSKMGIEDIWPRLS